MDLFWRDSLVCPSEDDYLEMVGNKTGGLFRLGIKLMQAESPHEADFDCVPLVNIIGPIDIDMLVQLGGKMNIPNIDIERELKNEIPPKE